VLSSRGVGRAYPNKWFRGQFHPHAPKLLLRPLNSSRAFQFSPAELLTAQQHDPFLQQVAEGVAGSDQGVWRDFFRNDQGFLCYQREGDAVPRIWVPKVSRDAVLHTAHGGALVGHPGISRTAANVAQFFWWPNIFRDVAHFVRGCRKCATAKSSSGLRLGVDSFSSVPIQPFTHWSMDLTGPLPKSRSGNDLIVTWVGGSYLQTDCRKSAPSGQFLSQSFGRPDFRGYLLSFWLACTAHAR
jgi:hypothetical protein